VWTTGDATVAYQTQQPDGRVKRVTRDVVFLDGRYVVLRDRVVLSTPGRISWLLHSEKNLSWDEDDDTAFILGKQSTLTAQLVSPGVTWSGVVTDEFPVPVDPKYVSGEVGSSYVTGEWSNQSHLTVQSADPAEDFTIFSVLWPERSGTAPVALTTRMTDSALVIQRPDGKTDTVTLTDTALTVK
jgi:hypothetical protein